MAQVSAGRMQDKAQVDRTRRGRWRPGVSGNPSGSIKSKRYLELHAEIVSDLGGESALTGIDRVIIGQAVTLLIRAEKIQDYQHCGKSGEYCDALTGLAAEH